MAELTQQQQTEFAGLRGALAEGDMEMVAAAFDILLSLRTPLLPLLDSLGRAFWNLDDEDELEEVFESMFASLDESAIPALAAYVMEEDGPDLMVDLAAERLESFSQEDVMAGLEGALNNSDERISEGVRDYLGEMLAENDDVARLLEEEDDDF